MASDLVRRLFNGERAALARAITYAESRNQKWRNVAQDIVSASLHRCRETGGAFRIGLSGPPGAGKSTFIEALGTQLVRSGHKVAVLSVDPSSSISGGSILGDKTRMTLLSRDQNAFVRPSPSSGTLGGVARNTSDAVLLCEAAGYDTVLVETVGVGQSEIAVADMVDMFVLVVPPGGGDELQGIKRGIVEMVDLVVVNKADGDLIPAARRAQFEYLSALKLMRKRNAEWSPEVVSVSSLEHTGLEKTWDLMSRYQQAMRDSGKLQHKRTEQANIWLWHHVTDQIMQRFRTHPDVAMLVPEVESKVRAGVYTAGQGADMLLGRFGPAS